MSESQVILDETICREIIAEFLVASDIYNAASNRFKIASRRYHAARQLLPVLMDKIESVIKP